MRKAAGAAALWLLFVPGFRVHARSRGSAFWNPWARAIGFFTQARAAPSDSRVPGVAPFGGS